MKRRTRRFLAKTAFDFMLDYSLYNLGISKLELFMLQQEKIEDLEQELAVLKAKLEDK